MNTLILDRSSSQTLMAYQGRTLTLDGRDDTWVAQLKEFPVVQLQRAQDYHLQPHP